MDKFELAINPELVKRILLHLKAGKHVVLVGAPGVGKTVLAERILKIFGPSGEDYITSVASQEWTSYDLIGGLDLEGKNFHKGYVTSAVEEGKWLLVDEFNRADINKAFGKLFLAIEKHEIPLNEDEKQVLEKDFIKIPENFRMICTMNDFDKNLLLTELSYGLITRFAFVDVEPDVQKERNSVRDQILESKENLIEGYEKCEKQIDSFFKFINDVRKERKIGVRTSIDIVRYLVISSDGEKEKDRWDNLDNALCDYLLPQFDRLDRLILDFVKKCMDKHFPANSIEKSQLKIVEMIQQLRMMSGFLDDRENE